MTLLVQLLNVKMRDEAATYSLGQSHQSGTLGKFQSMACQTSRDVSVLPASLRQVAHDPVKVRLAFEADADQLRHSYVTRSDPDAVGKPSEGLE